MCGVWVKLTAYNEKQKKWELLKSKREDSLAGKANCVMRPPFQLRQEKHIHEHSNTTTKKNIALNRFSLEGHAQQRIPFSPAAIFAVAYSPPLTGSASVFGASLCCYA